MGLALALLLLTANALAQSSGAVRVEDLPLVDRERARSLMDAGDRRMQQGDTRGALEAYQAADELIGVPTTGIEVGRALAALGSWVEALKAWEEVARYPKEPNEPRPFTTARREAERLASDLGARMPTLVVELEEPLPDAFSLRLDGRPLSTQSLGVPVRLDPGLHHLEAEAPGYAPRLLVVDLSEKSQRKVRLDLVRLAKQSKPEPPEDPRPARANAGNRAAMWAGFATALAGAAVGTATGIWAVERTSLAYQQCMGTTCPEEAAGDIEQAKVAGVTSTIAFVVSGAGLGVGVWQALVLGRESAPAQSGRASTGPLTGLGPPRHGLALLPAGSGMRLAYTLKFP